LIVSFLGLSTRRRRVGRAFRSNAFGIITSIPKPEKSKMSETDIFLSNQNKAGILSGIMSHNGYRGRDLRLFVSPNSTLLRTINNWKQRQTISKNRKSAKCCCEQSAVDQLVDYWFSMFS
jgi:hypothetical protein